MDKGAAASSAGVRGCRAGGARRRVVTVDGVVGVPVQAMGPNRWEDVRALMFASAGSWSAERPNGQHGAAGYDRRDG